MRRIYRKLGGITATYVIFNLIAGSTPIERSLVMITFIVSSTAYLAVVLWEALAGAHHHKAKAGEAERRESEFDRLVRLVRASKEAPSEPALEELAQRVRDAYLDRVRIRHGLTSEEVDELRHDRTRLTQIIEGEKLLTLLLPTNADGLSLETIDGAIEEIEGEAR